MSLHLGSSLSSLIFEIFLIYSQILNPLRCFAISFENQILELQIKAITSTELSSMTFNEIPSLFYLYENLTNKRFESIHKNNSKKFEEFRKVHQYYAIKNLFYSLKLSDIIMIERFNAEDLDVISKKPNWTDHEVTKYGLLGKEKEVTKYQFWKKEFIFHEKALADFYIAQYFYDNLIHPKDYPSDDEMELRIRFFLHVTSDNYNRKPLTNEFITKMIEDQNEDIFNDQVRMIMRYKFKYLLDRFLPDNLDRVESVSELFKKDKEILENLWGIDDNQPYFLRFFRFLSSYDTFYKLKDIAEKFFIIESQFVTNSTFNSTQKLHAENIFRGKNQILSVLYRIYEKKNENFTKDILDVTKYQVSDDILKKLIQEKNFLDFVDTSSFTVTEKREFYYANSYNMISVGRNHTGLMQFWARLKKYFNDNELKWFITQKETSYNHTQLFLLPSHSDTSYVETFLNLTKFYLNNEEIRDYLVQKNPISKDTFITRYIILIRTVDILEMCYNFSRGYLNHDELKELMFTKNPTNLINIMSGNSVAFKFYMKILSEFYTKDEILDMLQKTDEYNDTILIRIVASGNKYNRRNDMANYLRNVYKDDHDKLRNLLGARNNAGQTVFGRFQNLYDKDRLEPFLELAKEIFTAEEIEELYKDREI